jgi:chemotaxis protein methyltransferase WspC
MSFNEIARRAAESLGIRADDLGTALIARGVQRRIGLLQLEGEAEYLTLLAQQPAEIASLTDEIVVPETWFFRDRSVYSYLSAQVDQLLRSGRPLVRILSAPCATGEEPYSIALALQLAGINLKRVAIDALDVSQHNIAEARGARYSDYSFREPLSPQESALFVRQGTLRTPLLRITEAVQFHVHNLIEPWSRPLHEPYDFILCRNLLIYLSDRAQRSVLQNLSTILHPTLGTLILTPAEASLASGLGLQLRSGTSYCFGGAAATMPPAPPLPRASSPRSAYSPPSAQMPARAPAAASTCSTSFAVPDPRQLADRGELAAAQNAAEQALQIDACNADAQYVLALIFDALDREEQALEAYRKLLYLDPMHLEGLSQLAALEAKRGNAEQERLLRSRIADLVRAGDSAHD